MLEVDDQGVSPVVIAVMGITGTGKSTFIRLITGDDKIHVGHGFASETSAIQMAEYVDKKSGRTVMLIDTPGFDDSRGVTDTDILEMLSLRLGTEAGSWMKFNGIIYMHRISDPRVGGASRKNLQMFRLLCGDENLKNVCIVTTNWGRVTEQEGEYREDALRNETFKLLLDAGANMLRHDNTLESAEKIVSGFIPLPVITTQFELELKAGKKLCETSAGAVITQEMAVMQERHVQELAELRKEMEEAEEMNDHAWKVELEREHRTLEERMVAAEYERNRLERTLMEVCADLEQKPQLVDTQEGPSTTHSRVLTGIHKSWRYASKQLKNTYNRVAGFTGCVTT